MDNWQRCKQYQLYCYKIQSIWLGKFVQVSNVFIFFTWLWNWHLIYNIYSMLNNSLITIFELADAWGFQQIYYRRSVKIILKRIDNSEIFFFHSKYQEHYVEVADVNNKYKVRECGGRRPFEVLIKSHQAAVRFFSRYNYYRPFHTIHVSFYIISQSFTGLYTVIPMFENSSDMSI